MSQEQPRRPAQDEPIKYGDVFNVSGELAREPIAPQDASMMQSAENTVLGQTQKGGPAAVMQSAAARNEQAGLVGHLDTRNEKGVSVTEADLPGRRVITEYVAGQPVGQYASAPVPPPGGVPLTDDRITIGEALEASVVTAGEKPVDQADAAAIQAAEARATGMNAVVPGGVAASAQSAADANARVTRDEDKTKLGEVLRDATKKMPGDKVATREDAQRVTGAEMRNKPDMATHPGGVAASVTAAARINQSLQDYK